jgi:hypothetical protein
VNGEKMILGTSEGICLLAPLAQLGAGASSANAIAPRPAPTMAAALAAAAPTATATADETETERETAATEGEGGLLAKLFRRRQALETADDGPSTMAEDFRDLLNDSLEDEELRRRLQSGMGGRTQ